MANNDRKNCFSMIDENGKVIIYDVLFTYENEENGKNYIVYTDNTKDAEGNIQVYASIRIRMDDGREKLEAIETEREWRTIEIILETLQDEIRRNQSIKKCKEEIRNKINARFNEEFVDCEVGDIPF